MPFQDGVYYPLSSDAHSSASIPSLFNSPSSGMTPSSGSTPAAAATFKFRPRRETVDWRRIYAVDVDQVVSQLDVDALQEHVNTVTFCNLEGERCPRCQAPVDPALVKLLRLAQLTVEWLLHCQELLALDLRAAEERLAVARRERDELLEHQRTQQERARSLSAELKQHKKVIRTQQTLLAPRIVSHKCRHCEKNFLNSTFLQSHMQRRHPDEFDAQLRSDSEKKSQIDGLKSEISGLKEQIVQQQQALEAKAAREKEQQALHQDLLREMDRKIEDSRDGIRRQMEFLYNRNVQALNEVNQNQPARPEKTSTPERDVDAYRDEQIHKLQQTVRKQDRKWESRMQEMKSLHESEKMELQSELSQMRRLVSEQQDRSQQLQQEMSRRLQEKEQTIQTMREQQKRQQREQQKRQQQREQIKSVSSNTKVAEVPVVVAAPPPEPRQKRVVLEEPGSALKLDPIQELSEEDRDSSSVSERRPVEKKPEPAPEKKQRLNVSVLKKNPSMKKDLRLELKNSMAKRLGDLGVRPGQSGLKNQDLTAALKKLKSEQQNTAKRFPDYWSQRNKICIAAEKKLGVQRRASDPAPHAQARARNQSRVLQIRPRSSSLPPRTSQQISIPAVKQPKTPQPAPRTRTTFKTSTPNTKTTSTSGYDTGRRQPSSRTNCDFSSPPFSSDQESDDLSNTDNEPPPKPHQAKSATSAVSRQAAVTKQSLQDDDDWSDISELEEVDIKQLSRYRDQNGNVETRKPWNSGNSGNSGKENRVSELAKLVVRQSAERVLKIPAGGVSILPGKKDEIQELTYTDLEESSDPMVSSLDDKAAAPRKSLDFPSSSVWGTSTGKNPRSGQSLAEAGTGSTLKSSLCSLSDFSDSDDVSSKY